MNGFGQILRLAIRYLDGVFLSNADNNLTHEAQIKII